MPLFSRLLGERRQRAALLPLYTTIVGRARDPLWYHEGGVPDTIDGRFDMLAALFALVLIRLQEAGRQPDSVLLTELFIDDMDGSIRQLGIGDLMVGKQVGKMMGALGGRLGALRDAEGPELEAAVARNIFRDAPPSAEAVAFVAGRLSAFRAGLSAMPEERLLAGEVPAA